jgi:LysR family hydrogen peroxide-inducible transcriptional activator
VVAQPLAIRDASRRVSLVFRHSYPRRAALQAFADIILANLPNTVQQVAATKRKKKMARAR